MGYCFASCNLRLYTHDEVQTTNDCFKSGITCFYNCQELFIVLNWSLPQPAAESSSLPSGQSRSPSHSQRFGTQAYDPGQLNSPGAHVTEPARNNRTTCSTFKSQRAQRVKSTAEEKKFCFVKCGGFCYK